MTGGHRQAGVVNAAGAFPLSMAHGNLFGVVFRRASPPDRDLP